MADIVVTPQPAPQPTKPGYQTTEFWLSMAAAIAPYAMSALPPQYAVIASTAVAGLYTIGRSVVKYKHGEGKWNSVPEFPDPATPPTTRP